MKKIFVSAGLVAAGAAGLQSACAAGSDVVSPKAWNVSGTLRAFYDDNYSVANTKQGSFGIEVSPQVSLNIPLRQTDLGIRYIYGLYYYQERQDMGLDAYDQSHQVDLWLDHSFNERWRTKLTDSLAIGQEPALLDPNNSLPYRVEGNNLANHANVTLNTEWTRLFSTLLHYGNNYFDYSDSGATVDGSGSALNPPGATYAGLLNRIEQSVGVDFQWHVQPETMVFVGYNFSLANYTGDEPIAVYDNSLVYMSDARDSMAHYAYVGAQHEFTPNLSGMARIGASYTDSYNDPLQHTTSTSPYADINLSYTYVPGSYVQVGFTQDQNATDVATVSSSGSLTQYQKSSMFYTSLNHRFTPKLLGMVVGRYQYSSYEGGDQPDGDQTYSLGLNLNYQISRHFSTEIGYNFDDLESDIAGRAYSRNRVYLGLSANY